MRFVPVFATVLALIFLPERILSYHAIGVLLIIFGIIVTADWRGQRACMGVVAEQREPS